MQKWDILEIRAAANEKLLDAFDAMHIEISEMFFGSTDEHVLDVFGESNAKKKAKPGSFLTINVLEDKEGFAYYEIKKIKVKTLALYFECSFIYMTMTNIRKIRV